MSSRAIYRLWYPLAECAFPIIIYRECRCASEYHKCHVDDGPWKRSAGAHAVEADAFPRAKIVQTESNTKQACLFLLPRCSLSYLKIVQTNTKQARLFLLPRCSLSFCKIRFKRSHQAQIHYFSDFFNETKRWADRWTKRTLLLYFGMLQNYEEPFGQRKNNAYLCLSSR